ncbi:DASH family cryptochrome [Rhodohalobacter mucosus]|uniref:Cryptochrome DASH n=1 Tax=Rhodohalobacter mucosus TaxID=2079485 RepID=A0A316TU85_9BACT|nr:DASH family cryptochrome [Rhodohalobacter mucosus]PWN08107.1 cryptochrome DASH [Rhodohalobacter mucosus]
MKSIIWHRNDLRIKDHEPLVTACKHGQILPVYIFDPALFESTMYGFPKTGSHRKRFLIESVEALRNAYRQKGGDLIVRTGNPAEVLNEICDHYQADRVLCYGEVTSEETEAEERVQSLIQVPLVKFRGHALYHPNDLPFEIRELPVVFTQFRKKVEKKCSVRKPLPEPENINFADLGDPGSLPGLGSFGVDISGGDERSVLEFKGGEEEAWNRLNHYFFESDSLRNYKFTRNGLLGADYSSKLSPWLALGCISARSVHAEVKKYEREVHKNVSTYWLIFELIWRDYFRYSAEKHGNKIFRLGGIQGKNLEKRTDPEWFKKWAHGMTGIPFIDANMRELWQTGYMSNRGRQNVASFLAQNMDMDWRWGAAWFESMLIDYDVCSNWGNWAYNATVGHDPRNRYFNILNQADKYDKKGEYVRTWLPELSEVPSEFIHKLHTMSPDQQKLFGVNIAKDYPEPILDLEESYERIRQEG